MNKLVILIIIAVLFLGCTQNDRALNDYTYNPNDDNGEIIDRAETNGNSDYEISDDNDDGIVSETEGSDKVKVFIETEGYSPSKIAIKKGQTIVWENTSSSVHTVTSDNGTYLRSNNLLPGESYERLFDNTGIFAYHSAFRILHKGTVTVE